jgi:hypothetical protein
MIHKGVRIPGLVLLQSYISGMVHHFGFKVLLGVSYIDFACHFAFNFVYHQSVSTDRIIFASFCEVHIISAITG